MEHKAQVPVTLLKEVVSILFMVQNTIPDIKKLNELKSEIANKRDAITKILQSEKKYENMLSYYLDTYKETVAHSLPEEYPDWVVAIKRAIEANDFTLMDDFPHLTKVMVELQNEFSNAKPATIC